MRLLIILIFLVTACQSNVNMDMKEWIDITRFKESNDQIKSSNQTGLVVFILDSITEGWDRYNPDFFKNSKRVNRGISGHTSHQMLLRFRQDVVNLKPEMVIINCGTNDIAGNAGNYDIIESMDNIKSMCDLAEANKIKVVLCSVLPCDDLGLLKSGNPSKEILALNKEIKKYTLEINAPYIDFHSSMKNNLNGLVESYTYDGIHPNKEGYKIMESLLATYL